MSIPGDILFESSYVLALTVVPYTLTVRMDFALTPEHPLYTPPRPSEQECYARGTISITGFEKLTWEATGIEPSRDAEEESDHGSLDEFVHEHGRWRLACDAGVIELVGGTLSISLDAHARPAARPE
jgi:hypothetical protein